jgi:hypothetical protein
MKLSNHSLTQIDEPYIQRLDETGVRRLCVNLLHDLKEARDRLRQNSQNSSRPPSSDGPFAGKKVEEDEGKEKAEKAQEEVAQAEEGEGQESVNAGQTEEAAKRPGKPVGEKGVGRTQVLAAQATKVHEPSHCAGCGQALSESHAGQIYTGFQEIDVDWGNAERPGLAVRVTNQRYAERLCACGHPTQARWGRGEAGQLFEGLELSEWRLVGPGLATLIVALHKRFRMSYGRIQEFLDDWLGIRLSAGVLSQSVSEAGVAIAPAEEELVQAVLDSELLHADETPWHEAGQMLWLWVFSAKQTVLYYVAGRGRELLDNLLEGFAGCLMSDGWQAYRHFSNRLRCWAHLIRKAQGLKDSLNRDVQTFGRGVCDTLEVLMDAVYAAREGPPEVALPIPHADRLAALKKLCETWRASRHEKARALAVELLNDGETIFRILSYPQWPLTNHEAERALRHWVLLRKSSYGTRTAQSSRLFALLASVIDTCRKRGHSPWPYLRTAIRDRRAGLPLAPLPAPRGE